MKRKKSDNKYFLVKPKRTERVDFMLFMLVIILICFGLVMLFSASQNTSSKDIYATITRQAILAVGGLVCMFVFSRIDYHIYKRFAFPIYAIVMIFMFAVPLIGFASHGATRQISLGFFSFQPSELCKFAIVITFATLLSGKKHNNLRNFRTLLFYGGLLIVPLLACALQSHLSALILIAAVGFLMIIVGGLPWYWTTAAIAAGGAGITAMTILEPYRMRRITALFDPWSDPLDSGYQIIQSLYSVGSGGLMGLGFGQSRQKYGYLPEAQNDYIYAIVCEELGFWGGMIVILLFVLLVIRSIQLALAAKDSFGMYLAFGISVIIALQFMINVAVVLSVFPSTGMQLPFFSSGGTSLIIMMSGCGILMNISRYTTQNKI